MKTRFLYCAALLALCVLGALVCGPKPARAADETAKLRLDYPGKEGAGKGKHVVLIAGANEYNPEVGLPILGRILAGHHGFHATVLFTVNKEGAVDPNENNNIPGLDALDDADLLIILCRFRELPDDQMKHLVDYVEAGKPVIGLRTATHSFQYSAKSTSTYKKYTWNNKDSNFDGGFGRQVLGETWIRHHAPNGKTSTRALFAPGASSDPILRGIKDGEIWGTTGAYGIRPLLPGCKPLLLAQVIEGNKPDGKPAVGPLNDPMQIIAWTREYSVFPGKSGRAFTTTMGSAGDIQSEAFRRLIVNASYWAVGMEDKIPEKADVELVGPPVVFHKGITPAQMQ